MTGDVLHDAPTHDSGIVPEDRARGEIYALLGNLFYRPPSKDLLQAIATGLGICDDGVDSGFCQAWCSLRRAAAEADEEAVRTEYDSAFIGTGRQPVMLFGSFYLTGFLNEKPLAYLRDELAKMGLTRRDDSHETEDHISALCDVMRLLVAGDPERPPTGLDAQRDFFVRQINPWFAQLCDAVIGAGETRFYKHVARFAREFFIIENESFNMI
jgi:TorA maturation chaperone TorD